MAEALLNRFSGGRFRAFSADLEPAAELHPLTLEMLKASGLATAGLQPRSVQEFATPGAPGMDFVICMGKNVAARLGLPGNPMRAEWGISDPAAVDNDDEVAQKFAFRRAFRELENRIRLFVLVRHNRESERGLEAPGQGQNA